MTTNNWAQLQGMKKKNLDNLRLSSATINRQRKINCFCDQKSMSLVWLHTFSSFSFQNFVKNDVYKSYEVGPVQMTDKTLYSLLPGDTFCHLLITFAKSLDPDQAPQNVGPDLDPNCLTFWWYSLRMFKKKLLFEKNEQTTEKHAKLRLNLILSENVKGVMRTMLQAWFTFF